MPEYPSYTQYTTNCANPNANNSNNVTVPTPDQPPQPIITVGKVNLQKPKSAPPPPPAPTTTTKPVNSRLQPQNDDDMANQIKAVVEIALSNHGLSKEPYLVRQVSRSAKGFVSVKLIASLRQVRRLTRNIQLIIEALRRSTVLEVSDDGHKVRRLEPLPASLTKPKAISTILAIRVPEEDAEIDRLSAMFKCYGKIQQMRVVLPEKKLPAYLLGYATQVPELGREICAIIEFESDESAMAACKAFHHQVRSESQSRMRVALLGPRIKRSLYGPRRNSNGSISCQSSVISSSLDVSLEECVISSNDNITDTDSGFHQTQRNLATSSPRSTSDEDQKSPEAKKPISDKLARRRNSAKSVVTATEQQADCDSF